MRSTPVGQVNYLSIYNHPPKSTQLSTENLNVVKAGRVYLCRVAGDVARSMGSLPLKVICILVYMHFGHICAVLQQSLKNCAFLETFKRMMAGQLSLKGLEHVKLFGAFWSMSKCANP